jgi:hypothetical protein
MEHPIQQFQLSPIQITTTAAATQTSSLVDDIRRIEKLHEIATDKGLDAFQDSLSKFFKSKQSSDCVNDLATLLSALYAQHLLMGKIEAYSYLNLVKSSYYEHIKKNSYDILLYPDGNISRAIFDCATVSAMAFCIQKKDLFQRPPAEIIKEIASLYISKDPQLISIAEASRAYVNSEKIEPIIDSVYQSYDKLALNLVILYVKQFAHTPFIKGYKEWYDIHIDKLKQKLAQVAQKSVFDPTMFKLASLSQEYVSGQSAFINLYGDLYNLIQKLSNKTVSNRIDPKQPGDSLPATLKEIKPLSSIFKTVGFDGEIENLVNHYLQTIAMLKEVVDSKKPIRTTEDGYILRSDVTNSMITIHDTRNNARLNLVRKPNEKSISVLLPLTYAANVKEWLENPQAAIKNQGYTKVGSRKYVLTQHGGYDPILLHAFSLLVDDYLPECATETVALSRTNPGQKDKLLTIAGSIQDKNNKEMTGIFTYLINGKTGICYHRFFEPQLGSQLIENFYKQGFFVPAAGGYYDIAFPALSGEKSKKK